VHEPDALRDFTVGDFTARQLAISNRAAGE